MSKRSSGIILHPTSFSGNYGCGDIGRASYKIIDWMAEAGQKILQVLPLGPTGFGDSPYQSFSAFAGTPYIISFDELIRKGYLNQNDLNDYPRFISARVDYYWLYHNNFKILLRAYAGFKKKKSNPAFDEFCGQNEYWLDPYASFMAIKDLYKGVSWDNWDEKYKNYKNFVTDDEIEELKNFYKFIQWEFYEQWDAFKKYSNLKGVSIIGDAPIFVAYDSADVWSNQELFKLDKNGKPLVAAGVPPDYFSETGQLWGNPIYKWDMMKKDGFDWWQKRISHLLKSADCIRIDHFRGFESYWEIKAGEKTAVNGKWVKACGYELFNSLKKVLGDDLADLIIAEDLGIITEEVRAMKDHFNFPGMCIFEFADFPDAEKISDNIDSLSDNGYLPDNYKTNCVAYPGTHDNDTLQGWFESLPDKKRKDVLSYLKIGGKENLNFTVLERMMESKADRVIFLMQDIFNLSSGSRMNTPSTQSIANWSWRMSDDMLNAESAEKLYRLTERTRRL